MRSRRGLGVLAMCGLVLGMMAVSASGAQAGTWMINKANVTTTQTIEANIEILPLGVKKEKHVVLLTTSGASKIAVLCEKIESFQGTISPKKVKGKFKLNKCSTSVNAVLSEICAPLNQPIEAGGGIEAVLHEGKAYAKVTNEEGPFAILKFNEECTALTPTEKVTGTGWLEDPNGTFESELVTHLVQEATIPANALGGLKFGANPATIDGNYDIKFSDATHLGQTFSGLAE